MDSVRPAHGTHSAESLRAALALLRAVPHAWAGAIEVQGERALMAHSGDPRVVDSPPPAEASVRVLDANFLEAKDRNDDPGGHAAIGEWVHHLRGTPGHVILHHVSLRYDRENLAHEIRRLIGDAFPGECRCSTDAPVWRSFRQPKGLASWGGMFHL